MNKLKQAARQALEALEVYEIKLNSRLCNEAITALREALAEQEDEIYWIETNKALAKEIIELKRQAEQEYDWGIADAKIAAIKAIEAAVLAEREACAKACEPVEGSAYEVGVYKTMQTLAAAIRARLLEEKK